MTPCSGSLPGPASIARPQVSLPTARAAGIAGWEIVVDAHERYASCFAGQYVRTVSRALPCGDYGITMTKPSSPRRNASRCPT